MSRCLEKMRPRVGHLDSSPPKLIACKARHDFHSVEEKKLSKKSKIKYRNSYRQGRPPVHFPTKTESHVLSLLVVLEK